MTSPNRPRPPRAYPPGGHFCDRGVPYGHVEAPDGAEQQPYEAPSEPVTRRRVVVASTPDGRTVVVGPVSNVRSLDQIQAAVKERGWTFREVAGYLSWSEFAIAKAVEVMDRRRAALSPEDQP